MQFRIDWYNITINYAMTEILLHLRRMALNRHQFGDCNERSDVMKKLIRSITALLLMTTIIFTSVPISTHAATNQKVPTIRNVRVISDGVTFFGVQPYVIYEIDGTIHDSRYMSQKFNAMAWNAMNKEDRRRVNRRYWAVEERKEAFGDQFALDMGTWSDEALGYTAVKEALDKKWENRYAGYLKDIYGNENYETVRDGVVNFLPDSDAYHIVNYYKDDPLAKDFMARYLTVIDLMKWGKTYAYDQAVRAVLQMRALGVRSISKELIGIIVSNFMTPTMTMAGPSKAVGATTDLVTKLYDLFDANTGVSGKIQEYYIGKTVSTDDAVAAINKMDDLVMKRFVIAEQCYKEACDLKAKLEEEAPELLLQLQNPHPEDGKKRQVYEQEREERSAMVENPSENITDKSDGYSANFEPLKEKHDQIESIKQQIEYEQSMPEPDTARIDNLRKSQEKAANEYAAKKKAEEAELEELMNQWASDMEDEIAATIRDAGFEIFTDDYQFTEAEIEKYNLETADRFRKMCVAADLDNVDYYSYDGNYCFAPDTNTYEKSYLYDRWTIIPEEGLDEWESDLDKKIAYLQPKYAKLRKLMESVDGLFDSFYASYQPIAGKCKGYDDAVYVYPYGEDEEIPEYWGQLYWKDSTASRCLAKINAIPNDQTICDSGLRYNQEIKDNELAEAREKSAEYKEDLKATIKEYNEIKANFDLAWIEYNKDLQKVKSIFDSKVPQYVKDANIDIYFPTNLDANIKALVDKQSNPKNFLKTQAQQMTDAYDEIMGLRDELNIDQTHMSVYLQQMRALEEGLSLGYSDQETYYGSKTYEKAELFKLFGVHANVAFVADDPMYEEEQLVAYGQDGTVTHYDEKVVAKYGISYDELKYLSRLPVLATDFLGGTEYHARFTAAYTELLNRKGTVLRQMKNDDDSLYMEYSKAMQNAYNACEKYSYNSRYTGLSGNKVIDMYKEVYSQDGILATIHRTAMVYKPVNEINKSGNHNMNRLLSASGDLYEAEDAPDITVAVGGKEQLIVDVKPFDATDKELCWSTENSEIAEVDADGIVTGISEGTTTIQVVASDVPTEVEYNTADTSMIDSYEIPGSFILTYTVKVDNDAPGPADATGITLSADKTNLGDEDIATVEATVTPNNASGYVSWTVSPETVVEISSDIYEGYGATAEGWRVFVRGLSAGTATLTATTANGKQASIEMKVKQNLVQACDIDGNVEKAFDNFADAKEWIWNQYLEDHEKVHVLRITQDMTENEEGMDYGVSSLDYYSDLYISEKVIFDLAGHTLTVKRSPGSILMLQTGTIMRNGTLKVLGSFGLAVYGNVELDQVVAERMQVGSVSGEVTTVEKVKVNDGFVVENGGTCQVKSLTAKGGLSIYQGSNLIVDNLSVQDKAWIAADSLIAVNEKGYLGSDIVLNHEGESAYIARYKDAKLTINGSIEPNVGDMVLSVGVTDSKVTAEDIPEEGKLSVKKIEEQTRLYKTTVTTEPEYVKVWQPVGSDSKYTKVAHKDGAVYATAEGEPVIVPDEPDDPNDPDDPAEPEDPVIPDVPVIPVEPEEPAPKLITKLLLDKTSCKMGTGKEVTVTVTALSADVDLVSEPPVSWSENKNGSVISITYFDKETGAVTVKGVGSGTATLTATTTDGSNKKVSCTIKVGTSIEKINITQKNNLTSVEAGKKLALKAEILPKSPAPVVKTLLWESDNPSVAAVDQKGNVTGVSEGTANITARPADELYDATKETATFAVTVTAATKAKEIENISFKQPVVTVLAVGKSATIKAYTHDSAKNKDVALNNKSIVFYSNDENIISVTPTGKMTAKAEGSTIITAVSLSDPTIMEAVEVSAYVPVKKIVLNATKDKVNKGSIGVLTVAQWNPEGATNKTVKWTATGADGSTKAGNIKAVEIAVLPIGMSPGNLNDSDFKDARTTPVVTGPGERIAYRTLVATRKCVITACTDDGNKKAKCTVESIGEVTSLKLKINKKLIEKDGGYAATIKAGKSLKVTTKIEAEYGANKRISWISSSEDIVTVKNGTIKVNKNAAKGSKAVVVAYTADGKHTAKIVVTTD